MDKEYPPGTLRLNFALKYDAIALDISSERITIADSRFGSVWGDHLFRIVFTAKHATAQSTWSMNIMQT